MGLMDGSRSSNKKEWIADRCNNMDEPQNNCTELKKPENKNIFICQKLSNFIPYKCEVYVNFTFKIFF